MPFKAWHTSHNLAPRPSRRLIAFFAHWHRQLREVTVASPVSVVPYSSLYRLQYCTVYRVQYSMKPYVYDGKPSAVYIQKSYSTQLDYYRVTTEYRVLSTP